MRFTRLCHAQKRQSDTKGKLYNGEDHNLYFVTKNDEKIEDSGLQGISTCLTDKKCTKHCNRIPSENEDGGLKFWHNNFYVYHPVVLIFNKEGFK